MIGYIATILGGGVLAAVHASFFLSLPAPFSYIHLPLIAILAYITAFRFSHALVVAGTIGISLDLAFSVGVRANTIVLLITTLILLSLFTRVFTNTSTIAFVGITFVGFALIHTLELIENIVLLTTLGYPLESLFSIEQLGAVMLGMLAHSVASLIVVVFLKGAQKLISSVLLIR